MTESDKDAKKETSQLMPFDNIFGSLRDEIENAMRTWSTSPWIPSLFDHQGIRVPLYEVVDKGNLYELHIELPGVGKENVKVTANSHSIEVSGKKISRIKDSQKRRIYTERSELFFTARYPYPWKLFHRKSSRRSRMGYSLSSFQRETLQIKQSQSC